MPKTKKTKKTKRAGVSSNVRAYVNKKLNQDNPKFHNDSISGQEITSSYANYCVSEITSGNNEVSRGGAYVKPKWVRMSVDVEPKATSYNSQLFRIWIFQWQIDNSVQAPQNLTDVVYDSGTAPTMQKPVHPKFTNDGARLNVVWDSGIQELPSYLSASAGATLAGKKNYMREFNIPGHKFRKMTYNTGASTGQNQLYVGAISTNATGTQTCVMYVNTTIHWDD